jgi:Zn-dependent M28 family amino/carboxypeptidase
LQQQLAQWGAIISQPFQVQGRTHYNWGIALPGQVAQADPLLIGAHYDTVPGTVGADDNASGLAVLLELARLLTGRPARRPVLLMAFDLEEYGLQGSRVCAEALVHSRQSLALMLSLEMLGYCDRTPGAQHYPAGLRAFYPDRGDFIGLIGNWRAILAMLRLQRSLRQAGTPCHWLPMVAGGAPLSATRRSDHAPFWDAGYNAILVTDTADLRNPHYHRASDRIETLDLDFLTDVCLGLAAGLRCL